MSNGTSLDIRRIAHLDMDAFYASVELLRYPQLRGQSVVIGGGRRHDTQAESPQEFPRLRDYAGRGVVTTASYEAREFGVHSAMGLMKAAQLCPQAILLPVDFGEYRRYSSLFKLDYTKPGFVTELLAALTVRYPTVPIHFAETRPLAEEWTYRFLGAAIAYHQADRT